MSKIMFCSEVELGGFVGSIDVVPDAFRAILETLSSSLSYEFRTSSSGIQILAFNCCSDDYKTRFLNREFGLVSSETYKVVDFIATKLKPSFSINGAAVELFEGLPLELKEHKDELISKPLIVTGLSLGGYAAILFTLWLHKAIDLKESSGSKDAKTKRPICITFGCPLVGDERLQQAISERPQWNSSFLNVVAKTDPIASFFSSIPYKPFGTSFFCTESGGHTVFEDQDSVLAVLDDMASSTAGNTEIPDYGNHLKSIRRKVLYRGVSESGGFNPYPLLAGITWQFRQIGVQDSNNLIEKTAEKEAKRIKSKKNVYEPTKKLNEMKISLTYMEWYMKTRRSKGGYYDSHKKTQSQHEIKSHGEIVRHQRFLNQYWKKFVEEKDIMPQKEGAKLRTRWLLGGNNYRRIVEPLDIADYYKKGGKDYIANRSNHYKLLEDWLNEDKNDSIEPKTKAASLTEDSCFWAYVEEALIELNGLKNDEKLEKFESYVMGEINNYSLHPDVFLDGSSLRKWWNDYKQHKGSSYTSELVEYMNGERYKSYK